MNLKVRCGVTPRKKYYKYLAMSKQEFVCPNPECGRRSLVRVSWGIYQCKKCMYRISGKAYTLR